MTNEEIWEMKMTGATYEEIAELCGISKQAVWYKVKSYTDKVLGKRGHSFDIELIPYKGIYEYFESDFCMSITAFCKRVGANTGTGVATMRNFLTGKNNTRFSIDQIKAICETIGKPFEYVFEERKI